LKLQDPKIAEKLSEKERDTLKKEIEKAKDWVNSNPNAPLEDIKKKEKEILK